MSARGPLEDQDSPNGGITRLVVARSTHFLRYLCGAVGIPAAVIVAPFCGADEVTKPWQAHTIDDSSQGADGVRLMDVNGDGLHDIATAWEEGGIIRAYLQPSRTAIRAPWPAITVGKVASGEDAVLVDLDADGAVDVVSASEGTTRTMHVHWAPAKPADYHVSDRWTTEAIPQTEDRMQWMYTLPCDVDSKHGLDLVVGGKGKAAEIGWLISPTDPRDLSAWRYETIHEAGWIMSIQLEGLNRDGRDDILYSDRKGAMRGIYWLEYQDGEWHRHLIGGADHENMFLNTGDLDQDGRRDVVCATKQGPIVWYRRLEDGWSIHEIPLPEGVGGGKGVAIGDIDIDGTNDVVFTCEGADHGRSGVRWLSWEEHPNTGRWQSHEISGPAGIKFDRLVLEDVDQDGDLDVLTCEERDQLGVIWYENPLTDGRQNLSN